MRMIRPLLFSLTATTVLLAGCGGSSSTPAPAANTSGSATPGSTGSDPSTTDAQGNSGNRAGRQVALKAYTDCFASNGVTLPQRTPRNGPTTSLPNSVTPGADPADAGAGAGPGAGGFGGGGFRPGDTTAPRGVDQSAYDKALAACKDKLPAGGFGGGGRRLNNPAYVACMKDNGIILPALPSSTVPDATAPTPAASASSVPPIDRTSAAYMAANNKCKVLLPSNGSNGQANNGSSTTQAG